MLGGTITPMVQILKGTADTPPYISPAISLSGQGNANKEYLPSYDLYCTTFSYDRSITYSNHCSILSQENLIGQGFQYLLAQTDSLKCDIE